MTAAQLAAVGLITFLTALAILNFLTDREAARHNKPKEPTP